MSSLYHSVLVGGWALEDTRLCDVTTAASGCEHTRQTGLQFRPPLNWLCAGQALVLALSGEASVIDSASHCPIFAAKPRRLCRTNPYVGFHISSLLVIHLSPSSLLNSIQLCSYRHPRYNSPPSANQFWITGRVLALFPHIQGCSRALSPPEPLRHLPRSFSTPKLCRGIFRKVGIKYRGRQPSGSSDLCD